MTREEAIEQLKWYFEYDNGLSADKETVEAYKMAIKALEQINKIKAIIESPIYIQEDVFRYKAICEVFKSEEQA